MARSIALLATLLATVLPAAPAQAQSIRGVITERGSMAPVSGALVVLVDTAGSEVEGTLTNAEGAYFVRAGAVGEYRLRVDRIGYASTWSTVLRLTGREAVEHDIQISTEPIELTGIVVTQERRCTARPETGLRTASVWSEARKALALAVAAGEVSRSRYRARTFERELAAEDLRVRHERVRTRYGTGAQPYASVSAELLRDSGFVRTTSDGTFYYAPDASVLLSDAFLDTHCFHVTEQNESSHRWVGLAFEPIQGRRIPDIKGTFWLDPATAALHLLEYEYTNVDHGATIQRFGGRVEFERLPNGVWIVRRWRIRTPQLGRRATYDWTGRRHEALELTGILEHGGEVTSLVMEGSEALGPTTGTTLRGLVIDSTRAAPLAGAVVTLDGTQHATTTDSLGAYRIEGVPEGTYSVSFSHPRSDSLGLFATSPRPVDLGAEGQVDVSFGLPSTPNLRAALCGGGSHEGGSDESENAMGILVGLVRDASSGRAVAGARVRANWSGWDVRQDRSRAMVRVAESRSAAETVSDPQGRYRLCGIPASVPITARAEHLGRTSQRLALTVEDEAPVRLDFSVRMRAAGELRGRALDESTGDPIATARVRVGTEGPEQLTNERGEFRFPRLPPGRHVVTLTHIGYGTHTDSLDVKPAGLTTAELVVPRVPIELEGVSVTVRPERADVERARSTSVRLLDRHDLARLEAGARHVGDVLRTIPGIEMGEGSHADSGICVEALRRMRSARTARGCEMVQVYLDGVRLIDPESVLTMMSPADLESIEFLSPAEAGLRFGTGAGTGVLVIHTLGNGPYR